MTGALNAICKQIQKLDTENEPGSRSVHLSQHKEMLNGFSFSRNQVLESVLRVSIETSLDRVTGEAHITIPEVNTDMYLYNFRKLPYYRIITTLSSACDTMMNIEDKKYKSPYNGQCDPTLGIFESEWMPAAGVQPALDITLHYPMKINPIPLEITLMLCIGIEFGKVGAANIFIFVGKYNNPVGIAYFNSNKKEPGSLYELLY